MPSMAAESPAFVKAAPVWPKGLEKTTNLFFGENRFGMISAVVTFVLTSFVSMVLGRIPFIGRFIAP